MKKILTFMTLAAGLLTCQNASAVAFVLSSSIGTITPGNAVSTFYEATGAGVESGTAAGLYSTTVGGSEDAGWFVTIGFDSNPQPILTSAFLKASNQYLWWDATDLAAFNAGTYTAITLQNSGAGGIANGNGKYHETSHAGINGTPGQNRVPDGGATLALFGLALGGLGVGRRLLSAV